MTRIEYIELIPELERLSFKQSYYVNEHNKEQPMFIIWCGMTTHNHSTSGNKTNILWVSLRTGSFIMHKSFHKLLAK